MRDFAMESGSFCPQARRDLAEECLMRATGLRKMKGFAVVAAMSLAAPAGVIEPYFCRLSDAG
jgi:hypothetical protein